jgi:hypothetical protein
MVCFWNGNRPLLGVRFWPFWNIVDGFDVIAMNYPVQPHDYVVVLIHCITTDE